MKSLVFILIAVLMALPLFIGAQTTCGDVTMQNDAGTVVFSHDKHIAKGLTCEQCHPGLYTTIKDHKVVTMAEMGNGLSCGKCHNGNPVFSVKGNCFTCHAKPE